jgi:hypothetical protein
MTDGWLPVEEDVNAAISFCSKYAHPYGVVLFAVLMARQVHLATPRAPQQEQKDPGPDLPWAGLPEETVAKIRAFARSVQAEPGALSTVYEFAENDVTVIAPHSALGQTAKAVMQEVAILYSLARSVVYGQREIAWSTVKSACREAGIDDRSGKFAACMKDPEFPGTYKRGAGEKLKVGGSLLNQGRNLVRRIIKTDEA